MDEEAYQNLPLPHPGHSERPAEPADPSIWQPAAGGSPALPPILPGRTEADRDLAEESLVGEAEKAWWEGLGDPSPDLELP